MAPVTPKISRHLWVIAAITGSGAFMAMLDTTIANLALETIRADLEAPLSSVQWVATGYLISLAISLPLTGWLGHRFGDGRVWAGSVIIFIVASMLCAVSHNLETLVLSRCLQGLAAGLMVPAGQAVLAKNSDRSQLGRLMGTVGFAVALGPALGPAFGGIVIDTASWRWLFILNVPIGLLALIAAYHLIAPGEKTAGVRIDTSGFALISLGLPLLLYGAAEIGLKEIHVVPIICAGAGALLLLLFVSHAGRVSEPLIDLHLLSRPAFAAPVLTAAITGAVMFGGLFLLPIYLLAGFGQSATEAGFMLLAMGLGSAFVLPVAGWLTDRFGPRRISVAGIALLIATTAPFLLPPLLLSNVSVAVLLIGRGAGLALAQMPAITAAYGAVDKTKTSDAAVLINIAQRLGGAIGAISIAVAIDQFGGPDTETVHQIAFGLLFLASAGALLSAKRITID